MDLKSIAEAYQSIKEKKLDPVGKEDGDVNNDGKKDSTDSYLMNRRKAIAKAMKKEAYMVTNADKKGNTPAYQGYKAGKKNVKTGEPMYKAAPHMKEHHKKDADGNTIPHEDEIEEEVISETPKGDAGKSKSTKIADRSARSYGGSGTYGAKYNAPARDVFHAMKRGVKKDKGHVDRPGKPTSNFIDDRSSYPHNEGQGLKGSTKHGKSDYDEPSRKKDTVIKFKTRKEETVLEQLAQDSKEIDKFDAVIAYLIDENFAKDWDEAQKIMTNFKPEIIEEIYQSQLWTLFDESREYSHNPEKYHDSKGYDKKLEKDKPYRERSKAARMRDPERGINSPAFKKFMADRGM